MVAIASAAAGAAATAGVSGCDSGVLPVGDGDRGRDEVETISQSSSSPADDDASMSSCRGGRVPGSSLSYFRVTLLGHVNGA